MSKYGLDLINKIKPCTFQYKQTNENGVIVHMLVLVIVNIDGIKPQI